MIDVYQDLQPIHYESKYNTNKKDTREHNARKLKT